MYAVLTYCSQVIDKNDNEPQFDLLKYVFDVPLLSADSFHNRLLGTVRATDRDADANGEVTYSLAPADGDPRDGQASASRWSEPPTRFLQVGVHPRIMHSTPSNYLSKNIFRLIIIFQTFSK